MNKIKMPVVKPVQHYIPKSNFFKRTWDWLCYTRQWELDEDWYFILPDKTEIVISKGFVFDGASIPRVFRNLLSPVGILFLAGLVHDYSYKYNCLVQSDLLLYNFSAGQKFWDDLFLEVANETNGMKILNTSAWTALRGFGWMSWNGHRKNDKK